jgi:hypothetical protein
VDASSSSGHHIPSTLFGLFFEEINHAGTGGLWAELVQNRGFEAGGLNTPSDIRPWVAVGTETQVLLGTDRSSPFVKNPVALRVAILCDAEDSSSSNQCPHRGVGVSNPGFWGMVSRSLFHLPFYLSVILCCLSHTYKVSEFLIFFLFVFCRTFVKEQHIKSSFGCAQLLH